MRALRNIGVMKTALTVLEFILLLVGVLLALHWVYSPGSNLEPWIVLDFSLIPVIELLKRYEVTFTRREEKVLSPGAIIQHNEELRRILQEEILNCRQNNLRKDAIIRHVRRKDEYPEVSTKSKGISAWFRVGLMDVYHNGILVALRFGTLTEGPDGWRYTNYNEDEEGDINVYMIGKIPFDYIEAVNIDGDEYYHYPHIFCHYGNNGEPYEEVVFCEENELSHGHKYYREITTLGEVESNSKSWGGSYFS